MAKDLCLDLIPNGLSIKASTFSSSVYFLTNSTCFFKTKVAPDFGRSYNVEQKIRSETVDLQGGTAIGALKLNATELSEKIKFIRSFPLFSELSDSELAGLSQVMEEVSLEPGVQLLTQDQPADAVYFLKDGALKILVNGEMVAQIDKVQCFGEMSCLIPNTPASASVVTAKPSQLIRILKDDFLNSVGQITKLWKMLFFQMSERVRSANSRLSEILDHLPQGLLKVSPEGIISNDYSVQCTRFFQSENLAGLHFSKLAFPDDEEKQKSWIETFPLFFSDRMSFHDVVPLLTSEITINHESGARICAVTYSPCKNHAGKVAAVDIGIEDITKQKELERKNKEFHAKQEIRTRISENPDSFVNFMALADEVFLDATDFAVSLKREGPQAVLPRVEHTMRRLHNLKGISGLFSLKDFKVIIHETETMVRDLKTQNADPANLAVTIADSLKKFKIEKEKIQSVFDEMPPELRRRLLGVVFSTQEFEKLKSLINEKEIQAIQQLVTSVEKVDSKKLFEQWPQEAKKIADELGKFVQFQLMGEGGRISKDLFLKLDKILIHLLRNALDHGLEKPDVRSKKGKSEHGSIEVAVDVIDTEFLMTVADDGNGINNDILIQKAREKKDLDQNLIEKYVSSGEVWRILLMSGFSTAKEVTDLSGRGVGLDSVATAVQGLGGTLSIESDFGLGTRFNIIIPLQ